MVSQGAESVPAFEGERAIVVGAGMSGLWAAAVARRHFGFVTVLERDEGPGVEPRGNVPQAPQLHTLLKGGQLLVEQTILPGFAQALAKQGAGFMPVAEHLHMNVAGVDMPTDRDFGFEWIAAQRLSMERAARSELAKDNRVTFHGSTNVTGLEVFDGEVKGVTVTDRSTGQQSFLEAPVVIDATGVRSRAADWLGVEFPETTVGHSVERRRFSSMLLEKPEGDQDELRMVLPTVVNGDRGIVLAPIGNGLLQISASRLGQGPMPETRSDFIAHAYSIAGPEIVNALQRATPASREAVRPFPMPALRSVGYDLWQQPVDGFYPVGDSVENYDPIGGQGITAAAIHAVLLDRHLPEYQASGAVRAYHREVGEAARKVRDYASGSIVNERDPEKVRETVHVGRTDPALHELAMRMGHLIDLAEEYLAA